MIPTIWLTARNPLDILVSIRLYRPRDPDGNRVQKIQATGSRGDPAGTWQFLYDP